jgi:hypothetical protein
MYRPQILSREKSSQKNIVLHSLFVYPFYIYLRSSVEKGQYSPIKERSKDKDNVKLKQGSHTLPSSYSQPPQTNQKQGVVSGGSPNDWPVAMSVVEVLFVLCYCLNYYYYYLK